MTTEANKALVREFFAIIDRGDITALDGVLAPDFRLHLAGMPGPLDRAAATGMLAGLLAGMPGVRHQLHDLVAEGERVAVRLEAVGTHGGDFLGVPASGRPLRVAAINLFRVQDGRLTDQWLQLDALGALQQIGAMPAAQP